MDEAYSSYAEMKELLDRSGQYIAEFLGVEGAYVTSGCAAALVLSAAACITGKDPDKIGQVPDTTGLKNEVVLQKLQQYPYDRSFTVAGARLVFAGDEDGCTEAQLADAIGPDTVALAFVFNPDAFPNSLKLEDVVRIAHEQDVPVIVDAASRIYPVEHFRRTAQSADLVCFGAKYLGAPQSTGFLCGRKDLVEAAAIHGFIGFETAAKRSLGRGYKVDRRDIVGVVAALDEWASTDHEERLIGYGEKYTVIERALAGIPSVSSEVVRYDNFTQMGLHIALERAAQGGNAQQVADALLDGSPRVRVNVEGDTIIVIAHTLSDGEEHVVAERMRTALGG